MDNTNRTSTEPGGTAALHIQAPLRTRVLGGMRRGGNWLQLLRFGLVGASGYAVNLAVFALAVTALGSGHRIAATLAFLVAVTNNFVLNRSWTFGAGGDSRMHDQALRFLLVSLAGFAVNVAVLEALVVGAGFADVAAQAVAVAVVMPLNFLGNRLWTFA